MNQDSSKFNAAKEAVKLVENGIENPRELDEKLMKIDGVIDTGLFIDMATKVIVGTPDGTKIID